jgi:hypothetical protein
MANAGRHNFYQHFARLWPLKVKLDDFQWLFCFKCDCSAGLHGALASLLFAKGFSINGARAQA